MTIQGITHIATSPGASWVPLISGDGRYLLTNAYNPSFFLDPAFKDINSLVLVDLETGRVHELPGVPDRTGFGHAYGIDADGGRLIVSGDPTGYANLHDAFGTYLVYVTGMDGGPTSTIGAYGDGKAQFVPDALALSADGDHVAMIATRYDVSGNPLSIGLFEANLATGAVTPIVSESWQGFYPSSTQLALSGDGRYVVYGGNAFSYLTRTDPHNLYVFDMRGGGSRPISTSTDGTPGDNFSGSFAISGNGRYVVFESHAKNLGPIGSGDVPSTVYVKDLQTGAIIAASADANGHVGTDGAESLITQAISDDGRYVLFQSHDHFGLKELDGYSGAHLFVKDMTTNAIALVNSTPETIGLDPHGAAISGDGHTIVFQGIQMVNEPTLHAEFQTYVTPLPAFSPVSADDTLAGTAGADTLAGALGDDTYIVNNIHDIVVEYANQGRDTIHASVNYTLPDNVEVLVLDGANAINGTGNGLDNVITGNAAANVLFGGAGDDVIDGGGGADAINGGAGFDTVRFAGTLGSYTIAGGDMTMVQDRTTGVAAELSAVELLQFKDAEVTFDVNGVAAQAYRLYAAAFDRAPDLDGLGYWISHMQHGLALSEVAHLFTQSAEFKSMFGNSPSSSSLVDLLYQHILHRPADAAGAAYWVDLLDRHMIDTTQLLINFSESAENQAALVGLAKSGIAYHPYGG